MTVAKDSYLLSLPTSVACQIVSFSSTEAMEFFMDSNYLQYTMKYIRCNNHPLALHYLVVSLLYLVIHFHLNYLFILHIWQAYILCFIFSVAVLKIQRFILIFYLNLHILIYLIIFIFVLALHVGFLKKSIIHTSKAFYLSIKGIKNQSNGNIISWPQWSG